MEREPDFMYLSRCAQIARFGAARTLGLYDTRIIGSKGHPELRELAEIVDQAADDENVDFTNDNADDIVVWSDAVVTGVDPEGQLQYILVQAEVTATKERVEWTARRAELLAVATRAPVRGLFLAVEAGEQAQEAAAAFNVKLWLDPTGRFDAWHIAPVPPETSPPNGAHGHKEAGHDTEA